MENVFVLWSLLFIRKVEYKYIYDYIVKYCDDFYEVN